MILKESKLIFLTIFLIFSFMGSKKNPPEVINIHEAKDSVKKYYESGKYIQDVTGQVTRAKKYITSRLKKVKNNEKIAIVFSLDDTILSQYNYAMESDFSLLEGISNKWKMDAKVPPLNPIIDLYNFAKSKKLSVFIITNRGIDLKESTLQNLNLVGINDYNEIFFIPNNKSYSTLQEFKTQIRKNITESGYTIIVNIGDQSSDLKGGFAEMTYKLPNYINIVK